MRSTAWRSNRYTQAMGIEDVVTAPRSPWQNPFVERVIGTLRRECLDHVIVWNERALRRHLQQYLAYYHEWRTHLSLEKDAPVPRAGQPPTCTSAACIATTNGAPPDCRSQRHPNRVAATRRRPPPCVHTTPPSPQRSPGRRARGSRPD
jgi:Integrase core domain